MIELNDQTEEESQSTKDFGNDNRSTISAIKKWIQKDCENCEHTIYVIEK